MRYLIGGVFALFVLALAVGAIAGRVRIRSCCAVADPACDLRMRDAGPSEPRGPHVRASGPITIWAGPAQPGRDSTGDGAFSDGRT